MSESDFDSDRDFELAVQRAYEKRKAQIKAPGKLKQAVMAKAQKDEKGRAGVSVSGWVGQLAIAASVVLFLVVYLLPGANQFSDETQHVAYLEVQSPVQGKSQRISTAEEMQLLEELYAEKQEVVVAERQIARLTHSDDDGWTFETCDESRIMLSGEMMAMLQKYELASAGIQPHKPVLIAFDSKGLITGIEDSAESLTCD